MKNHRNTIGFACILLLIACMALSAFASEADAGDTPQTALALIANAKETHQRIDQPGDQDMFKLDFAPDANTYYAITCENYNIKDGNAQLGNDLHCALHDQNGKEYLNKSVREKQTVTAALKFDPANTYYLSVFHKSSADKCVGDYALKITAIPDDTGDAMETASALAAGDEKRLKIEVPGDQDMFKLDITPDGSTYFAFTCENYNIKDGNAQLGNDLHCVLHDQNGKEYFNVSVREKLTETAALKLDPANTYYLAVFHKSNADKCVGDYALTLAAVPDDLPDAAAEASEYAFEKDGQALPFERTYALEASQDQDWLLLPAPGADNVYTLIARNLAQKGEMTVEIIKNGVETALSQRLTAGRAETLTLEAQPDAVYHIRVSGKNALDYTLALCGGGHHSAQPDWVVSLEATCAQPGAEEKKCLVCQRVLETREVAKLPHTPETRVVAAPACTSDGTEESYCTVCGLVLESKTLPATGHTPGEWAENAPTCTHPGVKQKRCTACGEQLEKETLPALGHEYTQWAVTREATKDLEGEEARHCVRCGETETKAIEKLPKTFWDRLFGR